MTELKIQRATSGNRWEEQVGFSRAVRTGDTVYVAGTASVGPDGSEVVGEGDAGAQMTRCLDIVESALEDVGCSLGDVVRATMYLTDMGRFDEVAEIFSERLGPARPAATAVEVTALADPAMLVEVEITAVAGAGGGGR